MSLRHLRWSFALMLILALVVAACAPAATPTPTPRPTDAPTEVPVEEEEEVATEEAEEEMATEEAAEDVATEEAEEEMATEEAAEEEVATEEAAEEMATEEAAEEEPTEVAMATEEMVATEEMAATEEMMATEEMAEETIVDVAVGAGDFTTLVAAVTAADLAETLSGEGPFTVFAPTDEAFEAALEALGVTAEDLLADTEGLTQILLYHVVDGAVMAADLEDGQEVETLQGESITVSIEDGTVMLNDSATVVTADVAASNGVIHVIDAVLLPPSVVEAMSEMAMTEEATEDMGIIEATEEEPTEVAMVPTEAATEEAMEEVVTEEAVEEVATEEAEPMVTEAPVAEEAGETVTIAADENVVVGLAAALSGEGLAALGIDIQRGGEIAVARRSTVTVDGAEFSVVLDAQDDLCSAEGGQAIANRFVSGGDVVAVVGPMCSSACRAAAPIFDAATFTTISPSCTAADLTMTGSTSFNRVVVSDAFQGRIAADYIYTVLGVTSIATIHDGSPYGEGLVAVLTERFEELGGEVVAADAVNVGDTDFRGLLEDIAQEDPELIYFGGFPAEAARLIVQRADAGLDDVTFMSADGVLGTEVIELAGAASEGMFASAAMPAVSDDFDEFLAEYVETYGEEPPGPYHAHAFDGVNVILNGIEEVGTVDADGNLVIDRAALAAYVRSFSLDGLTGSLTADGTGESSFTDIGISEVIDGEFVRVYIGRVVDGEVVLEAAPAEEMAEEEAAEEEVATEEAAEEEAVEEATAEATEAS